MQKSPHAKLWRRLRRSQKCPKTTKNKNGVLLMLTERFLKALKQPKDEKQNDQTLQVAATKIQNQKRLSSKEFLSTWDTIRKDGPSVQYKNPNAWRRDGDVS
jgi:hypothetical protein